MLSMKRAHFLVSLGLAGIAAGSLVYAAVDGPRATLMSERDYEAAARNIEKDVRKQRVHCASLAGYEASVCGTETQAQQSILMAELTARYLGTVSAQAEARKARIEGELAVDNARCEAFDNDSRNTCRQIAIDQRHAALRALDGPA
ncbi:hypothetical protein DSM104443_01191 [Usitatibacter rugosus]|uniref:UrcA family protein n=2 Tax=Usitatibacter rugosus TaxID=2732067 RepID=A0A6M4GX22_9PROT|nr:hypothetical protein DSM104443_01191 [Usitatibacter rugosus]